MPMILNWTLFRHNSGPNETTDAPTRGGKYKRVIFRGDREDAIAWWKDEYGKDPTRLDGWPETGLDDAWLINEVESVEAILAEFDDVSVDSGGIGAVKSRPTRMKDLHEDDRTHVLQETAVREEGVELPEHAADQAKEAVEKSPEHAGVGEKTDEGKGPE